MTAELDRRPRGVLLPLVTPFKDGAVDHDSIDSLLARYRHVGLGGIVLAGTTGEAPVLSQGETEEVVSHVADALEGTLPIFLGVSGNDTRAVSRSVAAYNALPVDGYLITAPYYSRPSQSGIALHFDAVAEATDRAIIVYNIPYRTGVNITNATLMRMADCHGNIIGVKDSCGDTRQSLELLREGVDQLAVLTGEDHLFFTCMALGGAGGILASAHIATESFVKVFSQMEDGQYHDALSTWNTLSPWIPLLFEDANPAPLKAWLAHSSLISSPECRLPLAPIDPRLLELMLERIAAAGHGPNKTN